MNVNDIKPGTEYVIDSDVADRFTHQARTDLLKLDRITAVVEDFVTNPHTGRRNKVTIRFTGDAGVIRDGYVLGDPLLKVSKNLVLMSVEDADRLAREREEAAERAEQVERERRVKVGSMIDPEALSYVVGQIMYDPADPARTLVNALDGLMAGAQALKDRIEQGFEPDPKGAGWSGYVARKRQPVRDGEEGCRVMPSFQHDSNHLEHRIKDVHEALRAYDARAAMFNALSRAGVDFERAVDIMAGREDADS
jgi:hypothetical protein